MTFVGRVQKEIQRNTDGQPSERRDTERYSGIDPLQHAKRQAISLVMLSDREYTSRFPQDT
jgi:hypothetical protein